MNNPIRVAVNGFGRIGKLFIRSVFETPEFAQKIQIVGINDTCGVDEVLYRIQHDSVHGRFEYPCVKSGENWIRVADSKICVTLGRESSSLQWDLTSPDFVVDCTGKYLTEETAMRHIQKGAKRVLLSALHKELELEKIPTFVYGVNHLAYTGEMQITSGASCTTNCMAPLAKVLDEQFEIEKGFITTVHAATNSQYPVDGTPKKQWRTSRAALNNIIPCSTGAIRGTELVCPTLRGKIQGMSVRVPVANVSMLDFVVQVSKSTDLEAIFCALETRAQTDMNGVLSVVDGEFVSQDFLHDERTCLVDRRASMSLGNNFFKLIAWYDNEWAYASKLAKLICHMHCVNMQ